MRVIPGTGPVEEVIQVLEATHQQEFPHALDEELQAAVTALRALDNDLRLGVGYRTSSATITAITALQSLARAVSEYAEDDVRLRATSDYLHNAPHLMDDLNGAISEYMKARNSEDLRRLKTFSLILFRHNDLDGAVAASLIEERDQWRAALKPDSADQSDLHLAIIPPPSATEAVARLADHLQCGDLLPCVVFLGDKPDLSVRGSLLTKWSARRIIEPGPSIPDQLRRAYRTVYGRAVPGRGRLLTATADKYTTVIHDLLDIEVACVLVAGGLGGSVGVDAVNTLFRLFGG